MVQYRCPTNKLLESEATAGCASIVVAAKPTVKSDWIKNCGTTIWCCHGFVAGVD